MKVRAKEKGRRWCEVNLEERVDNLEIEIRLQREFTLALVDEIKKFNQLADQISNVTKMADEAITSLSEANITK